jgi:hypothetical protein
MTVIPETIEATSEQAPIESPSGAPAANKQAFRFMWGAQKMLFDEMIFTASEIFERAVAETRLFTEFVSKASGAHSVAGFRELGEECGQHQIDFIRRDCERLFRHSERTLEVASKILASRSGD